MGIPTLKSWHFVATEDIMTKFKSQGLHIIRIKYWNASGSGSPPSLIPTLWNIGILLHKRAKRTTMHTTVHIYVMTLTSANERPRCMYIIYYAHTIFSAANANYVLFENRDTIYIGGFLNLVKPRRHLVLHLITPACKIYQFWLW